MKIKTAVKEYLVDIEIRKYSPRTISVAKTKLRDFEIFCHKEFDIVDMDDVMPRLIKEYTIYMMRKDWKGTTINNYLKTLKSFIQYCYDEDFGGFDAKKGGFKWVKEEKTVITTFTKRDVKLLLDSCAGNNFYDIRDYAVLTVLFETGVRCFEMCGIKPEDIKEDYILIRGKNNKQRVVPITPLMKKAFMRYDRVKESFFEYKTTDKEYFLSRSGRALNNASVQMIMRERGKGIEGVRVSPHTCRHFFAQQQIKMGTDIYTISRLLGHENLSITQVYLNSLKDADIIKLSKGNSVLMSM